MRPKKVILCVGVDEVALSILTYTLRTHAYAVIPAIGIKEAIDIASQTDFDLLLVTATVPIEKARKLIDKVRTIHPHRPSLLQFKEGTSFIDNSTRSITHTATVSQLLEYLQIMCRRKRGPQPGSVKNPIECVA